MKPESHRAVTSFALDLFQARCGDSPLSAQLKNGAIRNAVLDGTELEDAKTFERGWNWHFYEANETLAKKRWTMRRTSRNIMKKRQEQLFSALKHNETSQLFGIFGRVLHHIQDMNTPSHVVPVYHAENPSDPFEKYLVLNWPSIVGTLAHEITDCTLPSIEQDLDFCKIYNTAAQRLLDNLTPDGNLFPISLDENTTVLSHDFWKPYDPGEKLPFLRSLKSFKGRGFGKFGPLGESFGNESCMLDGKMVSVNPSVFSRIAIFFVKDAVQDSLKALQILSSRCFESSNVNKS